MLKEAPRHLDRPLAMAMFIAGGCLMSVEIIAGLTIAPFFGSSVFVWGSVIGVFMGALSLGYALGGRLAERPERAPILTTLLFFAGLLILFVPWYGGAACRMLLGLSIPTPIGMLLPLAAAWLLYFPPTVLLGMVSPLAVRIGARDLPKVGGVVGWLYGWNALGSVAGGLSTTFGFVTFFGNRAILSGCGLVLVVTSGFVWATKREKSAIKPRMKKPVPRRKTKPVPGLLPLVFTCGVVMMSFEVIAGAQIAPYFGSSVFVWGSVISVFLTAMTLGYRLGGKMVDRRPSMRRLAVIVTMAGFFLLLLPTFTPSVCQAIQGISLGEKGNLLRPLLAASLLFFFPTLLFAMVAPFAVRLAAEKVDSVGRVAGGLYALSTLGNMAGVMLTTFLLIPLLGKTHVFEIAGIITLLSALFALFLFNRALNATQPRVIPALVIMIAVALVIMAKPKLVPVADKDERVIGSAKGWDIIQSKTKGDYVMLRRFLDDAESPYHHIAVIDEKALETGQSLVSDNGKRFDVRFTTSFGSRRMLKFDHFTQSSLLLDDDAASIRKPIVSGTTYTDMLHLPIVLNPDIRDVLIIGGGGGVVPMVFKQAYRVSVDVVEIDPVVVKIAKKWFGLEQDERLRIFVQDGRMFIHKTTKMYDLIIIDVYTAGDRIPFHLTTREFLVQVKNRLRPQGIAAINLIGAVRGPKSQLFWAAFRTFQEVFEAEHVYVFPEALSNPGALEDSRNIILMGSAPGHKRLDSSEIAQTAARLRAEKKIPIATIPRHASNLFDEKEFTTLGEEAPILTDDYAPVDMMMVRLD